jgi:hypothetical protein
LPAAFARNVVNRAPLVRIVAISATKRAAKRPPRSCARAGPPAWHDPGNPLSTIANYFSDFSLSDFQKLISS